MKKTNWRVPAADRSLSTFVEALIGLKIVVELNNDAIARGVLESSDGGMNLTLTEASLQPLQVRGYPQIEPHMFNTALDSNGGSNGLHQHSLQCS